MPARPIGRPSATSSSKTGVYLDEALKLRASIAALRAGCTLSELVTRALVAYLAPGKRTGVEREGR